MQFIEPDAVDITDQITFLPGIDVATGEWSTFVATTRIDGGNTDPNSLIYQPIPIADKSLIDMLGNGSVDVITQIKDVLTSLRANLDDVQKLEVDANFALDNALDLTGIDLGNKDQVVAAVEFLRSISPSLHSDSTSRRDRPGTHPCASQQCLQRAVG